MQSKTIAIGLGAQRIQLPVGGPWLKVKLANESAYQLNGNIAGVAIDLEGWWADVYDTNGANFFDLTATQVQQSAGSPSASIVLTVAGPGEKIDGTYPVALVRSTAPSNMRAWDAASYSNPGAGVRATVSFTGTAGFRQVLTHAHARYGCPTAVGDGANFVIRRVSNGFTLSSHTTVCPAGTSIDVPEDYTAYDSGMADAFIVEYQTVPQNAGNFQSVSCGLYLSAG